MMTKKELRKELLDTRKSLVDVSEYLVNDLIESNLLKDKNIIALYYPLPYEINVLGVMNLYDAIYCFPKVVGSDIIFYKVNSLVDFKKGTFNVFEPSTSQEISRDNIDAFIIPCVGICFDGKRIGYGKGYYDRYLSGYRGIKIALNYKECSDLDFKADDYDVKIDYIFKR